jgi:hypothetical protein
MDAASLIMLAKIVTDLIVIITMAVPKLEGVSEEEKAALLKSLQENTQKLMAGLIAMATK